MHDGKQKELTYLIVAVVLVGIKVATIFPPMQPECIDEQFDHSIRDLNTMDYISHTQLRSIGHHLLSSIDALHFI